MVETRAQTIMKKALETGESEAVCWLFPRRQQERLLHPQQYEGMVALAVPSPAVGALPLGRAMQIETDTSRASARSTAGRRSRAAAAS